MARTIDTTIADRKRKKKRQPVNDPSRPAQQQDGNDPDKGLRKPVGTNGTKRGKTR